jgi:membrane-associated protease RseP (regulator of RpoE activity)
MGWLGMVTLLLFVVAIALLIWGWVRARPTGQAGLLAWMQSVVLMLPWLLFFGLFSLGIYLNLATILFLILGSTGAYIYLGRRLRILSAYKAVPPATFAEGDETSEPTTLTTRSPLPEDGTATKTLQNATSSSAQPPSTPPKPSGDREHLMPASDLAALEGIFGIDTFFRTETVPYGEGAIFRGNLRGEPDTTLQTLTQLADERLDRRYRLFLIPDANAKPVVLSLPRTADPQPLSPVQVTAAIALAVLTFLTCLEASGILMGFDLLAKPEQWRVALPFATGLFATLLVHEIGHRLAARQHHVKLSLPFLIPTWEIGSFGALTRIESTLPDRKTLFDIAFGGPALGGILSLGFLVTGLVLSHPGSSFQIPTGFFQGSVLVGTFAKIILGSALAAPLVDIHPLTLVGWLGLVVTALNLVPAGQLDGGRIVQAIYGRKIAGRATVISLIILAIASLTNPLALYWAVFILFLQRSLERPALNELTEPDDARAALALLLLFLSLATLLPLTPTLAGRLGIG